MESEVRVKSFSEVLAGREVNFYILCMKQSFLLWAGVDISFRDLSVAMKTKFVSKLIACEIQRTIPHAPLIYVFWQGTDPLSTQLLGDATNSESGSLSKRLGE